MNLTDAEILELHELCSALADDRLSPVQGQRLQDLLAQSPEARTIYFQSVALSNSLAEYAGEMQADVTPSMPKKARNSRWPALSLAAAAALVLGLFLRPHFHPSADTLSPREEVADGELQTGTLVARVTGTKNCTWKGATQLQAGDAVHRGQQLELNQGTAEITFDCGAQVVLDGPAVLSVESAWEAILRSGGLKATVDPQAAGFRVRHSSVEVLDLGTEFSIVADAEGDAEVKVLKGSVEVSPVGEETVPAVLHENESRAFGKGRKSRRSEFAKRHARLALATALDRWKLPANLCHWSFDENAEGGLGAQTVGLSGSHSKLLSLSEGRWQLTDGRWNKALKLDGATAVTAPMPGISRAASRTVAFWVQVPHDAQLSDSQAIIAWPMQSKKSKGHVLEIGWNRDPNQGPLGALRTELGKIYAVGATPLRDGRWHHIAVVFVPIGPEDGPVQVTQYVDGGLEGTTLRAIKTKRTQDTSSGDVMWLGRSPSKRNKPRYFRGALDELFVADRALSPPEILRLMTENQPPRLDVAQAGETALSPLLIATTP